MVEPEALSAVPSPTAHDRSNGMFRGIALAPLASAALAVALVGSGPVSAQSGVRLGAQTAPAAPAAPPPSERPPVGDTRSGPFIAHVPDTLLRLSKIVGVGVIGSDHTRLGDVQDVLLDREGKAQTVVIGAGGFLGLGAKNVAIPFATVAWNTDVRPTAGPSASLKPADAPPPPDPARAAEAMPGRNVKDETLRAAADQQQTGGTGADPGAEPATPAQAPPATVIATNPGGGVEHAEVHLTKGDLQGAPAFKYGGEAR